jgi:hypothetical protein
VDVRLRVRDAPKQAQCQNEVCYRYCIRGDVKISICAAERIKGFLPSSSGRDHTTGMRSQSILSTLRHTRALRRSFLSYIRTTYASATHISSTLLTEVSRRIHQGCGKATLASTDRHSHRGSKPSFGYALCIHERRCFRQGNRPEAMAIRLNWRCCVSPPPWPPGRQAIVWEKVRKG